ncbi:MAG TPA: hypothetical protein VFG91_07830 [Woeseiaceae bacterium]|nr:hypothetical protein [Woeseiaceae bacterium]
MKQMPISEGVADKLTSKNVSFTLLDASLRSSDQRNRGAAKTENIGGAFFG